MCSPEGVFLVWDYLVCLKDLTPARNGSTTVVWRLRVCMEAQICAIHVCISINIGREMSGHLWKLIIWGTKLHRGLLEKLFNLVWMSDLSLDSGHPLLLSSAQLLLNTRLLNICALTWNPVHCKYSWNYWLHQAGGLKVVWPVGTSFEERGGQMLSFDLLCLLKTA